MPPPITDQKEVDENSVIYTDYSEHDKRIADGHSKQIMYERIWPALE
jgi:hypothetical protein